MFHEFYTDIESIHQSRIEIEQDLCEAEVLPLDCEPPVDLSDFEYEEKIFSSGDIDQNDHSEPANAKIVTHISDFEYKETNVGCGVIIQSDPSEPANARKVRSKRKPDKSSPADSEYEETNISSADYIQSDPSKPANAQRVKPKRRTKKSSQCQ